MPPLYTRDVTTRKPMAKRMSHFQRRSRSRIDSTNTTFSSATMLTGHSNVPVLLPQRHMEPSNVPSVASDATLASFKCLPRCFRCDARVIQMSPALLPMRRSRHSNVSALLPMQRLGHWNVPHRVRDLRGCGRGICWLSTPGLLPGLQRRHLRVQLVAPQVVGGFANVAVALPQ